MTTTLRVTLDELAAAPHGGMARYAGELARALVATAPEGARVVGVVPASPEPDYERILARVPGLAFLDKSALARRELAAAWRRGVGSTRTGLLHATSLLAPLGPHDRVNRREDQVAVTIHDAIAWTHPELLPARQASWQRAMASRAERYADAIVVPSHAVAAELGERLRLGDRVRVIPGAPSGSLIPSDAPDADEAGLELPARYLLTVATTEPKKNLAALLEALPLLHDELPLVVVGDDADAVAELAGASGVAERVRAVGPLGDEELGRAYLGARAYVQPSLAEGFGLAVVEALAFGLPIVHTDAPALEELTADAALSVPLAGEGLPGRLAEAIDSLDDALADRLATAAGDRARLFDWRDSAERVWQLHADL